MILFKNLKIPSIFVLKVIFYVFVKLKTIYNNILRLSINLLINLKINELIFFCDKLDLEFEFEFNIK